MRSLVSAVLLVACVHPASLRIEPGMGHVARSIRTTSPEARRHFEAGLALAYGFNYDEAAYEFVVALHADPSCAMCAWGLAYVSGPNINDPFKQGPAAVDAAARAVSLAKSPVEVALARAIGARFGVVPTMEMPERQKLDAAYTAAMRTAAQAAPDDDDVQTLYAEALIQDTPPFVQAWPKDGSPPLAHVVEARAVIERVLARSPEHIGAIHFYTHIVDGGPYMKLAVPYAERLALLAPNAGHLVHMPSHLYLKLGRYGDAEDANRKAIEVDLAHLARVAPGSNYAMFTMHPKDYLWNVLLWEGKKAAALEMVKIMVDAAHKPGTDPMMSAESGMFMAVTSARFGMWDVALKLTVAPPGPSMAGLVTEFARGLALVAKGRLDEAEQQMVLIRNAATIPDTGRVPDFAPHDHTMPPGERDHAVTDPSAPAAAPSMPGMGIPAIFMEYRKRMLDATSAAALAQLEGAIAAARGDRTKAIADLQRAAQLEMKLTDLGELSPLPIPARQRLGALLLDGGDAAGAEAVYRADLAAWPDNGWSLFGLAKALEKQGKKTEATDTWLRFEVAWKRSDIKLTRSVF